MTNVKGKDATPCAYPHSNQGFGVGISRRSNRRADYNDDSRYSVRSLVDQSRRNAEGLRCQPRSSSNCFQRENRLADRHLEFEQDARNPPVFTLCPWILNSPCRGNPSSVRRSKLRWA